MSSLRESALRRLGKAGQAVGQGVGQGGETVVPPTRFCPDPVGQDFPQNSAKNGLCPTVPPIRGRDSGTSTLAHGTTTGTASGTSAHPLIIEAKLKEWHGRLKRTDQLRPPADWRLDRWLTAVDDACWIYENFAGQAVRDGFDAFDLFGIHPVYEAMGGIAHRLHGARNLKMTSDGASWSRFGVAEHFCKGAGVQLKQEGLVLLWEVRL